MTTALDMIAAELLKLRKRRGLYWWSLVLTVGIVLVIYAVLIVLHLVNGAHHGPAGGTDNFNGTMEALGALGGLTATLIGTTAGADDQSAGVFRDLVATGRSRLALYAVRVPGAMLMLVPIVAAAYAVVVVATYAFAGELATPAASLTAHYGLWLLVSTLLALCMGIGFAALIGSRGIAIGVLLAWQFVVGPIVASIGLLGVFREVVSSAAVERLRPVISDDTRLVEMSLAAAVVVLVAWTLAILAAGAWRVEHQDA